MAASDSLARASSSGPSRTVPGPNSAKKSAMADSATLAAAWSSTRVKARIASSPMTAAPCSNAAQQSVEVRRDLGVGLGRDAGRHEDAQHQRHGEPAVCRDLGHGRVRGRAPGDEVAGDARQRPASGARRLDPFDGGGAARSGTPEGQGAPLRLGRAGCTDPPAPRARVSAISFGPAKGGRLLRTLHPLERRLTVPLEGELPRALDELFRQATTRGSPRGRPHRPTDWRR